MRRFKICPHGTKWKVKWKGRFFWNTCLDPRTFAPPTGWMSPLLFATEEKAIEHIQKLREIDRKVEENKRRGCREIVP